MQRILKANGSLSIFIFCIIKHITYNLIVGDREWWISGKALKKRSMHLVRCIFLSYSYRLYLVLLEHKHINEMRRSRGLLGRILIVKLPPTLKATFRSQKFLSIWVWEKLQWYPWHKILSSALSEFSLQSSCWKTDDLHARVGWTAETGVGTNKKNQDA